MVVTGLKRYFFVFIFLATWGTGSVARARLGLELKSVAGNNTVIIPFGINHHINYNLKTGELMLFNAKTAVFTQIYAAARYNRDSVSSRNYTERRYSQYPVADGFGKGKVHVITLTGRGLPTMRQLFYTYPGKQFFLTALEVKGHRLQTNAMFPFKGEMRPLQGEVRTVFFPFDNDTFIRYRTMPLIPGLTNTSAEVGLMYDNNSRKGIVAGSVEHGVWKTGVRMTAGRGSNRMEVWAGYTDVAVTRDSIAHGTIKGDNIRSPKIMIGCYDDWRLGMEDYGRANRIADPPCIYNWTKPTPVGWNSWGVLQDKLTLRKAISVADFFADSLKVFRTGKTAYIDLDAYWDFIGAGDNDTALKTFVQHCLEKGLQPGIYWAPFTDWGWKDGAGRRMQGSNYTYGQSWTKAGSGYHNLDGARAMDPTHPGTKARIKYFMDKFKAYGFRMIKIDFLGHGAVESAHFYDSTVTTGMQAYRAGMEYLVSQFDGRMLVYAAISPSLATGRYVHSRRIACDAFKTIADTRYTMNSLSSGWWQTYLYNYIDADHVVFDHQTAGENRARMLSALITGTFITGDDFSASGPWSKRARQWYQSKEFLSIIEGGKAFRPVDGTDDEGAANMFLKEIKGAYYLAIFNYGQSVKKLKIDTRRLGLNSRRAYIGTSLFDQARVILNGSTTIRIPAADAMIIKFLK